MNAIESECKWNQFVLMTLLKIREWEGMNEKKYESSDLFTDDGNGCDVPNRDRLMEILDVEIS